MNHMLDFTEEELNVLVKILVYDYNELIRYGELHKLSEDECDLFVDIIQRWKQTLKERELT